MFRNGPGDDLWYALKHPPRFTPTSENSIIPIYEQTDPKAEPVCGGANVGLYIPPIRTMVWCTRTAKNISPRLDDVFSGSKIEIKEWTSVSDPGTSIDDPRLDTLSRVWLHELMHTFFGCECFTSSR